MSLGYVPASAGISRQKRRTFASASTIAWRNLKMAKAKITLELGSSYTIGSESFRKGVTKYITDAGLIASLKANSHFAVVVLEEDAPKKLALKELPKEEPEEIAEEAVEEAEAPEDEADGEALTDEALDAIEAEVVPEAKPAKTKPAPKKATAKPAPKTKTK